MSGRETAPPGAPVVLVGSPSGAPDVVDELRRSECCRVEVVRTSVELAERLEGEVPALVVLDVALDDDRVRAVLRRLQVEERFASTKMLLVSDATPIDEVRGAIAGWARRVSRPPM